jgi:hypothetical protein
MPGGIYLIQGDGSLVEMGETAYDSEDLLQGLLAEYPNLLAGDQIGGDEPRRWLLVSREVPLASEEEGSGRWSVDHLFLDQDAIPTIVEVKRSTDARIRREIVGQMLDYAANAVVYWPVEDLRARFETGCEVRGADPEAELEGALGVDDVEGFWEKAKTNLQAGSVRLVFVADEIPAELRRVVEFLNGQMDPAEVLAVEIKQYVGQGMKTLVPRVVGQKSLPPRPPSIQWDEPSFFQALEERRGAEETASAMRVLEWAREKGLGTGWGKGRYDGSLTPELDHGGSVYKFVRLYTYGSVEILFEYLSYQPPFDGETVRLELLRLLNEIPGVSIPQEKIAKRPTLDLGLLKGEAAMERFLGALDWVVQHAGHARPGGPRYPEALIPDTEEVVYLSSGEEVRLPKARPTFEMWAGEFDGDTYGGKPVVDFGGEPMFAELAILKVFQEDGWDGVWVDTFGHRYLTSWGGGGVDLPEDKERLLQRIFERAGTKAGCFDVFCWKGDSVVFAESKRASKDRFRDTQYRWVEAAIASGAPPESLLVVEWAPRG